MAISSLRITDFRNLATVELSPCQQGLNIICGNNGSGKTSLLEAIHYLGLGRSFRSASSGRLIRHESDKFSVFAQLLSDQRAIPVGVERELSGLSRVRMAERDVSNAAELAYLLPLRLINSHSYHIFESGPAYRRKYLDWGLFYHFDNFLPCWRHFERVLKQRNAVIRDRRPKCELDVWSDELVRYGNEIDGLRRDYVKLLAPLVFDLAHELLGVDDLQMEYLPGWGGEIDYEAALSQYLDDYRVGYTQYGPHRADLDITIDGISVKHFLSRGQQKLLICAMIIAQGMLLAQHANKGLVYLVDDLPSELDLHGRKKLISLLSRQKTQIFITAIEQEAICDAIGRESDVKIDVFHVEHGRITSP